MGVEDYSFFEYKKSWVLGLASFSQKRLRSSVVVTMVRGTFMALKWDGDDCC